MCYNKGDLSIRDRIEKPFKGKLRKEIMTIRKKILAVTMAVLSAAALHGCAQQPEAEESSEESSEVSVVSEVSEKSSKEPSKQESSQKPSKQESSQKPKTESKAPVDTGPRFVDSTWSVRSNFSDLQAQNSDTVGWVAVPSTPIDYVVLQSKGDALRSAYGEDPYYLCRDFYGNDYFSGSIFLDFRSDVGAKNMMLHGHSMANGTMFAGVLNFDNLDFYKTAPVITFNTTQEAAKWKIISVIKVNTYESQGPLFVYLRSTFGNDYDFLNFVYQLRLRSVIDCPVDVNESDQLVTLSTCAYDFDGFRQVIIARKVRPGEDSKVDVSKAKYNANPLYPDVWYNYYGGTKPTVTSFQDALNKKQIKWYDGTRKWSKKDDDNLAKLLQTYKDNAERRMRNEIKDNEYSSDSQAAIEQVIALYMPVIRETTYIAGINDLIRQGNAVIAQYQPTGKKKQTSTQSSG